MWCLSADEISSCIIHSWHIAAYLELCWEPQIGFVCSNPGERLWRQWERAPYCLRVGNIHFLDAPENINSDVIWHCCGVSGLSTTYTLFQVTQPQLIRPSLCSCDISYSPLLIQSHLKVFFYFPRDIFDYSSPLDPTIPAHSRQTLCSQPHTHTHLTFQLRQPKTSFSYLSSFSCGLPPGGPPSALMSSIVRMFGLLRPGGCLAPAWWNKMPVELQLCFQVDRELPVLCCCEESVGSQFLRFLAAALQPSWRRVHPYTGFHSKGLSLRHWYLFFKHYMALSTFQTYASQILRPVAPNCPPPVKAKRRW